MTDFEFDVIIRNGMVYDGSAELPVKADIAITEGRIALVGSVEGSAGYTVDAEGLAVSPGFIDVHNHCDLTFNDSGWKRAFDGHLDGLKGNLNYLYQGVTTVVTGNCGWGDTDTGGWLGFVDSLPFGTNVVHLTPHGMLRDEITGRTRPTELSRSQMDALKARVAEEMDKGAAGMSAGLAYAPGLSSPTGEFIELCRLVRSKGGLFTVHMRDESGVARDGRQGVLASIREVIQIAEKAEIPVEISHLKISAPIGDTTAEQLLELISGARERGLPITADQYPYDAGSSVVSFILPDEFKETGGGVCEVYKTGDGPERIRKAISGVFSILPPEKTLITMYPQNRGMEGKNLLEIAEEQGREPAEVYTDMVLEDDVPLAVFFGQDMDVVRDLMAADFVITSSDGWAVPKGVTQPHPRVYGSFPAKIKKFALDEKRISLPGAIRSMTSLPAEQFGLKERGWIRPGYVPDINVLDLSTITDLATYREPHQFSRGVVHLFIDGKPVIRDGKPTGDRNGRGLRLT